MPSPLNTPASPPSDHSLLSFRNLALTAGVGALLWTAYSGCPSSFPGLPSPNRPPVDTPDHTPLFGIDSGGDTGDTGLYDTGIPQSSRFLDLSTPSIKDSGLWDTSDPCFEGNVVPRWVSLEVRTHMFNLFDLVIDDLSIDDCTVVDDPNTEELELDGIHCDPGWYFNYNYSAGTRSPDSFSLMSVDLEEESYLGASVVEVPYLWCSCDYSQIPYQYTVSLNYSYADSETYSGVFCLPNMDEALFRLGFFTLNQEDQIDQIRAFP